MIPIRAFRAAIALGTIATALSAAVPSVKPPTTQHASIDGIAIDLDLSRVDDGPHDAPLGQDDIVRLRFRITDETTGTPLSGLFPAAWMDLTPRAVVEDNTCGDKVEAFLGGGLMTAPELDLNIFYVLALNEDATISVVDPLFGFGTTKLLTMIFLPSPGEDWVLDREQAFLYVSMPDSGQVAIIDTATWKLLETVETGGAPRRLALQTDGRYLWTAVDGDGSVVAPRREVSWLLVGGCLGDHSAEENLVVRQRHRSADIRELEVLIGRCVEGKFCAALKFVSL